VRLTRSTQLAEIIPYAALQFGSYAALKSAALARRSEQAALAGAPPPAALRDWEKFVCGIVAGSASKLALHPVDVAKKRMQVQGLSRAVSYGRSVASGTYGGGLACLLALARSEGLRGLYKGLLPNLLKAAPASGITFVSYEAIIGALRERNRLAREKEEESRLLGAT
jgi:solute carrier family 25 thiamine pyrophosphate transporter 19